ncbi:MAG: hypothetical protein IJ929_01040 [Prevotella sp.]|nr:hypothetical protein [Prevotella sp.]
MRRVLSFLFACLCLLHAMAQTGESLSHNKFEEELEKQIKEYSAMMHQSLPKWFSTPNKNEYVGCSLPNKETCTHHETAILSAILNYIISNINFGTSSHVTGTVTYNEVSNSENSLLNSEKIIIFPIDYRVVRMESDRQHAFVAVEVDTLGKGLNYCTVSITTKWQMIGNEDYMEQKIDIAFLREGRYTINLFEDDNKMRFAFMSEKTNIFFEGEEKPLQNHNVSNDGLVMKDEDRYIPVSNTDIGIVFWQATLEELVKTSASDVFQKYKNIRNYMEHNKLCVLYKPMK